MGFAEFLNRFMLQFETLPERLSGHIGLSLTALTAGILISIPLGIAVYQRPRIESVVMTAASIIQTIPSLALLALMVFAFQTIGWIPALVALILYSILPMLRNTVTGIQGVDPACTEAAAGIGMNPWQTLFRVQLPLALPTIVSGIRTASVWVVGAATLAQPVGATSLGNYIFVGLQTWNLVAILFGCLFSALLALAFDWLLHGLEIAAARRSLRLAITMGVLIAGLALVPLLLSVLDRGGQRISAVGGAAGAAETEFDTPLVIASKNFSESYILMELIRRRLTGAGLPVDTKDGMGSTVVFRALGTGEVDCYVDYTGTIWANQMKQVKVTSPAEILVDVASYLKQEFNVISLGPLGFSNDYVFAMRPEDAKRLGIGDLNDLAEHSGQLRFGADIEFFGRQDWTSVRDAYGLEIDESRRRTMEPTLMYQGMENGNFDVIVAFRTDGRTLKLAVLEDPLTALPPYDGILMVSRRMARNRKAMAALRPLIEAIDSAMMSQANAMVDVDGQTVAEATDWLESQIASRRQ
jgi:osmoprotectant transport system permease protein